MDATRHDRHCSNQFPRSDCSTCKKPRLVNAASQRDNDFTRDSLTAKSMYRTELCRNFMTHGTCRYEADCIFSHGSRDRRSLGRNRNLNVVNENKYRRGVCRYIFARKACPYGNRCTFIHEQSREIRDVTPERYGVKIRRDDFDSEPKPWWKTRLCSKWMINGCDSGAECTYAHGRAELRSPSSIRSESRTTWLTPRTSKKNEPSPYDPKEQTDNQKTSHNMFSLNWKSTKKIVGIYADWIDEDLPMHCSDDEQVV